jgi:site-specific recombinase XerD
MAGKPRDPKRTIVRVRAEDAPDEEGRSRWLARWTLSGIRQSETLPRRMTEEEAAEAAEDMQHRIRRGKPPSPESSPSWTVRDVLRHYLRDLAERGVALRHLENEGDRVEQLMRVIGHVDAEALEQADLDDYVSRRRRDTGRTVKGRNVGGGKRTPTPARSTVEQEIALLVRAYKVARRRRRITVDPPPHPVMKGWPVDARPKRRLTEGEVARLVAAAESPELGRLLEFLAWCPRRPIAIFGIRRRDCFRVLDEALPRRDRQVFVQRDKGGQSTGWSPLTETALLVLERHLRATKGDPDDLVWTSETGKALTPALLWYPFRRAVEAAGLEDVQVYDLRRFGSVQVQAVTRDLEVTCEYTGHRDVRTLLRYLSARRGVAEDLAPSIGWTLRLVETDEGEGTA